MSFAYDINHFVYYTTTKQSEKEKKTGKTEEGTGWQTESKQLLQKFAHGKEQPSLLQKYKCTRQQGTDDLRQQLPECNLLTGNDLTCGTHIIEEMAAG